MQSNQNYQAQLKYIWQSTLVEYTDTQGKQRDRKKKQPAPVIIEGKEEWEVERILNK